MIQRRQKHGPARAGGPKPHTKLAEIRRRLQEREVECRALSLLLSGSLDASADPTAILDSKGAILAANIAWQRSGCRQASSAVSSAPYAEGREAPVVKALLKRVRQEQSRAASVTHSAEVDGTTRWYQTHVVRIDDVHRWLVVIHHDVTENEAAKHAVLTLTERLVEMQGEERQRIARELHDSTSQHLASVGLQLSRLRRAVPAEAGREQIIGKITASLREAQAELRAFTYLLHPPELDRDGLKAAIEAFVRGFAERTRLKCRCRVESDADELAFEIRRSIFRVLQEALANVYRHASADNVYVSLRIFNGSLRLLVKDDGRGISKANAHGIDQIASGVGIPGMQARMHRLGGRAMVKSTGRGTRVVALLPLRRRSDKLDSLRRGVDCGPSATRWPISDAPH